MTNNYKNVLDRFIDEKLTSDDILLEKKISHFYKTKMASDIQEIIDYLRSKSISNLSLELANELEKLMKPEESVNATTVPESVSRIPANHEETIQAAELKQNEVFLIAPETEIEIHPLAASFHAMEGEEYEQLKSSMEKGQQNPIIMDGNVLLDGRNRLNACRTLGIPVKAIQWNGSGTAEELILALNLFRRHLSASQRAALAVKLLPALEQQAEERMKAGKVMPGEKVSQGKAVDIAGKKVGVSGKYITAAKKVATDNADTYQKLLDGKLSLAQAIKESKPAPVSQPDAEQPVLERYSLFDAIRKIIILVPDELNNKLYAIAEKSPPLIKKALASCFQTSDSDADDTNRAEGDAAPENNVGADVESDVDVNTEVEAQANAIKDKGYSPEIDF